MSRLVVALVPLLQVPAFLLPFIRIEVLKQSSDWKVKRKLGLRQDVDDVELQGEGTLLGYRQHLEPREAFHRVQHLRKVDPLHGAQWLLDRDLQAVQLAQLSLFFLLVF